MRQTTSARPVGTHHWSRGQGGSTCFGACGAPFHRRWRRYPAVRSPCWPAVASSTACGPGGCAARQRHDERGLFTIELRTAPRTRALRQRRLPPSSTPRVRLRSTVARSRWRAVALAWSAAPASACNSMWARVKWRAETCPFLVNAPHGARSSSDSVTTYCLAMDPSRFCGSRPPEGSHLTIAVVDY
jgi:hypothetical protein